MKNKMSVEVLGVKCKIVTTEGKGYMLRLVNQVENLAKNLETSSKDVALAVTALSYCNDVNILQEEVEKLRNKIKQQEEIINEYKNRSEAKKYTTNPLRLDLDKEKNLVNFYEKIDE